MQLFMEDNRAHLAPRFKAGLEPNPVLCFQRLPTTTSFAFFSR